MIIVKPSLRNAGSYSRRTIEVKIVHGRVIFINKFENTGEALSSRTFILTAAQPAAIRTKRLIKFDTITKKSSFMIKLLTYNIMQINGIVKTQNRF